MALFDRNEWISTRCIDLKRIEGIVNDAFAGY